MQYMVAGMMFGQGNYLAHYGVKGMEWGKHKFGDEYEIARGKGKGPAKFGTAEVTGSYGQVTSKRNQASQSTSSPWLRNYYGKTRQVRGAVNAARIGVSRWATNTYNRAASGVNSAYNTARGYVNRGIDAVSNRDEYARMIEAQQSGNDQLAAQLAEEYNSHWMTRAQGAINRGTSFVQNLFSKVSGSIKDAAGKALSYAKSTWNQIKTKAAPYVNAAKNWLEQLWNKAKGAVNRGVVKAKTAYMHFQNERRANQARADIRARQEAARKRHSGFLGTPGN